MLFPLLDRLQSVLVQCVFFNDTDEILLVQEREKLAVVPEPSLGHHRKDVIRIQQFLDRPELRLVPPDLDLETRHVFRSFIPFVEPFLSLRPAVGLLVVDAQELVGVGSVLFFSYVESFHLAFRYDGGVGFPLFVVDDLPVRQFQVLVDLGHEDFPANPIRVRFHVESHVHAGETLDPESHRFGEVHEPTGSPAQFETDPGDFQKGIAYHETVRAAVRNADESDPLGRGHVPDLVVPTEIFDLFRYELDDRLFVPFPDVRIFGKSVKPGRLEIWNLYVRLEIVDSRPFQRPVLVSTHILVLNVKEGRFLRPSGSPEITGFGVLPDRSCRICGLR